MSIKKQIKQLDRFLDTLGVVKPETIDPVISLAMAITTNDTSIANEAIANLGCHDIHEAFEKKLAPTELGEATILMAEKPEYVEQFLNVKCSPITAKPTMLFRSILDETDWRFERLVACVGQLTKPRYVRRLMSFLEYTNMGLNVAKRFFRLVPSTLDIPSRFLRPVLRACIASNDPAMIRIFVERYGCSNLSLKTTLYGLKIGRIEAVRDIFKLSDKTCVTRKFIDQLKRTIYQHIL